MVGGDSTDDRANEFIEPLIMIIDGVVHLPQRFLQFFLTKIHAILLQALATSIYGGRFLNLIVIPFLTRSVLGFSTLALSVVN